MNIKVNFDNIKVKETKKDFTVKILMLKGEKGEQGDLNPSHIVDNLTSNDSSKVLSAKQGKVLKDLVDDNTTKINKKPYYFNTVADMKAYNLNAGDMAITKGYYSVNDGGGGEYNIVSTTSNYSETLNNNLKAELIIKDTINVKQFGCYGDDIHDDTTPLENSLNYATNNNYNVAIPTGIYKITRQIIIKYYRYKKNNVDILPKNSIKIYGLGTLYSTKDLTNSVVLKGYNIQDLSSILAFTGRGVDSATSVSLENICLQLDNDTCEELSFCLIIGDANFCKISHCCFKGYNDVMHRCSSAPDDVYDGVSITANGYLFANVIYEQCKFDTNLYLDWDKVTINTKNKFGFAVVDERLFVEPSTNWKIYPEDSVTFNNCLFRGAVYHSIQQGLYNNCMWEFPTAYKPDIDITNDERFNQNYLDNKIINCSIGLTILAGKIQLNSPYFEDCIKQINVRKCLEISPRTVYGIIINNAHFNTSINGANGAIIDGSEIKSEYAINIEGSNYSVNSLILNSCYFNPDNPFTVAQIKNTICRNIEINNCWGIDNSLIIDSGSHYFHCSSPEPDIITEKFEVTMTENGGLLANVKDQLNKCFKLPNKKYLLTSAKIYFDGQLSDGIKVRVFNSNNEITSATSTFYDFKIGPNNENTYDNVITDNSTYSLYQYNKIPGANDGANWERKWDISAGHYIAVSYYNNGGASSSNVGRKMIVELTFRG